MPHIVNIGILAHVDAGKTSLTERILFEAGVIPAIGSVDHGTTQTDTLELERQRGITIQSAVVSFQLGDRKVNLIDTPGHPDFIAEVERALGALDGVVLVVSAVEGVQAQTRRLARAIKNLRLPCLVFVNKIDRVGARDMDLLRDIQDSLHFDLVPVNRVQNVGSSAASTSSCAFGQPDIAEHAIDVLSRQDASLLDLYVHCGGEVPAANIERALQQQSHRAEVSPVVFGSAMTGAGVGDVLEGIRRYLPVASGCEDAALSAEAFKIQRSPEGERIVYFRIWNGSFAVRERVDIVRPGDSMNGEGVTSAKVTGIDVFANGKAVVCSHATAGEIVRVHGLGEVRVGDWLGEITRPHDLEFGPPVFESRVQPVDSSQRIAMNNAITELVDQDPLIASRRDERTSELFIRLYGEVQKEVVRETLRNDFGVEVTFDPSHVVCIERLIGRGAHIEYMGQGNNPFAATIGLRIEPGPDESGVRYDYQPGSLPHAFYTAIEDSVRETLQEGMYGWEITDCRITLTDVAYSSPVSVAADFRNLAPLVLVEALRRAGTMVCEPVQSFTLSVPVDRSGDTLHALVHARAVVRDTALIGERCVIRGTIPAAEVDAFERKLPEISRGIGEMDARHAAYAPVVGDVPTRRRSEPDPFDRGRYLARLNRIA